MIHSQKFRQENQDFLIMLFLFFHIQNWSHEDLTNMLKWGLVIGPLKVKRESLCLCVINF